MLLWGNSYFTLYKDKSVSRRSTNNTVCSWSKSVKHLCSGSLGKVNKWKYSYDCLCLHHPFCFDNRVRQVGWEKKQIPGTLGSS